MNPFIQSNKQISLFVTAGYPQADSLPGQLLFLQEQGVDFIEIGMPFSDPMADGPVVQHASSVALQNGMNISLLLEQVKSVRDRIHVPLVLMGYFNPVLQFDLEHFLYQCEKLRISSLILPDLSVELYAASYQRVFRKFNVPLSFLITPKTPDERVKQIADACSKSFVYLVGMNSITGKGYTIDDAMQQRYGELKTLCGETPLFLGFGIDSKAKIAQGFEHCDGVIIGSAYLKALGKQEEQVFLEEMLAERRE